MVHLFGDIDMNEPWQWGTPIAWDHRGRAVAFRLDLTPDQDGDEVITNVTWADGPADADPIGERDPHQRDPHGIIIEK